VLTTIGTKPRLRIAGIAVLAASVGGIRVVVAQQPQETLRSVDVSECVGLATPEERLACFEARVEAAGRGPAASGAPAAGSAPAASGTTDAGSSSRGRRGQDEAEAADPPDIFAKVTELRETVPNSYLITLDNGQVWRQTAPEAYPLREGSDVRIYYSKWRTFRLTSPVLKGFIQVERVR
jgi:hypothetical protein